ncbi:multisubunit sodium/proton antiporter MrpG subunit [Halopolyspora algeriensis]|uniref:Multisubunit sodium/proton antiporter MrpG subunit n=1 Tax=Halopolyspora algeriensis TaxID=1500506 RepID=A0A368VWE5_9ACTN|nr:monovalent cation/H(+) antiporter subunit G [Halopolyspora algeriensis]RCW43733.1 multisubunit sodium/proton antiporter MrpG subunit [Halopolyspora algeriensis]TQM47484.1 multisubunit sodium/proton antiporter MrpG subunit [Halopolyspora algeriensis]
MSLLDVFLDVFSAVCLLTGALSCLLGSIGLARFPDVGARLQAATKPQTFGLLLILVGSAVHLELRNASGLILVALFQLLTAPVLAQLVGRAAYRANSIRRDVLVIDELGQRLDSEKYHR